MNKIEQMTSKEIKALNKEELNLAISEVAKKIRGINIEKERRPYQKVLDKLIKEFNKRGYGIWYSRLKEKR